MELNKTSVENFIKNYYPFIIFFVLMAVLHAIMGLMGDDVRFSKVLSNHTVIDYAYMRYHDWSSRMIIESVLISISHVNMIVWKILDLIIYTGGVYLVIRLINRNNNKYINLIGVLLFLMYPFHEMASAGWISTTVFYSWCFIFGLISFIPIINEVYQKSTSKWMYVISFLCLIYAVNQEQSCALIFGFNCLYLLYCIINKKEINKFNILAIIIAIASLIFIFTCPGNAVRVAAETARWYPEFASFGLMQKLYLGLVPTFGLLFEEKIIFPLFYIILCVCASLKTENKYLKYFLYLNIAFMAFLAVFKTCMDIAHLQDSLGAMGAVASLIKIPIVSSILGVFKSIVGILPGLENTIYLLTYEGIPKQINIYTVMLCIYLLLSSCILLFKVYGKNNLLPVFLFIGGFLSRLMMGFTPTVFASGYRAMFFFYMFLIMLTLMMIKLLYDEDRLNKKWQSIVKFAFILLAAVNFMFVFVITHVMY